MSGPGGDTRARAGGVNEQRLVFGEDPELYDRARPGYPDALVDDVLAFSGAGRTPCRALEVGAGTGKATIAFARRGVRILALEPDPAMAGVAARHCEPFSRVAIHQTSFEDWPLVAGAFDLVFCAQAWHWVRPDVRCALAAAALVPGGTLALFWHRILWAQGDPVREELDECYRRHAPTLYARAPGFPGLTPIAREEQACEEVASSERFTDVALHAHPWQASFGPREFVELLQTQSDHRVLDEGVRRELLDAVHAVVERHAGRIVVPYTTFLVLAHRVP